MCTRCNKSFKLKGDYMRHLNRKMPCSDNKNDHVISPIINQQLENLVNDSMNDSINEKQHDENINLSCTLCNKSFCNKYSLERHIKGRCKVKKLEKSQKEKNNNMFKILINNFNEYKNVSEKQINELRLLNENQKLLIENQKNDFTKQIGNLKKEIEKTSTKQKSNIANTIINNTITNNNNNNNNNNTTNNQQINININAYNKTDMSFLSNEDIKTLLRKDFKSIESLVEIVHFDKNRPENHNIYISNIKEPYVLLYDGKEWKRCDKSNTMEELYNDKTLFLNVKYKEFRNNYIIDEKTNERFGNYCDHMDDDDIKNNIEEQLKLLLYNKREIPMKTRKIVGENENNNNINNNRLE